MEDFCRGGTLDSRDPKLPRSDICILPIPTHFVRMIDVNMQPKRFDLRMGFSELSSEEFTVKLTFGFKNRLLKHANYTRVNNTY